MKHENPIANLINKWPDRSTLASEIGLSSPERVHKWAKSGSIPQEFLIKVLRAAHEREIPLTPLQLLEFHEKDEDAA